MTTGRIHFSTYPDRALIYIDDRLVIDPYTEEPVRTPAKVDIYEGEHYFMLKLGGYCDEIGRVYVMAGTTTYINRNLSRCLDLKPDFGLL